MIEPVNEHLDCGLDKKIPISVSSRIHDFAAFYFFVILTFTNTYYVISLWDPNGSHRHTFGAYFCLILMIFNLFLFVGYVLIAVKIGLIKMHISLCGDTKHSTLRVCNFAFEAMLGLVIVALAITGSMKRNDEISFLN